MLTSGYGLQMSRITAAARFAPMMEVQFGWSKEKLPDHPMHVNRSFASADVPVTIGSDIAQPEPAAGIWLNVNLFLNAFWQRAKVKRHHCGPSMAEKLCWGQFIPGGVSG